MYMFVFIIILSPFYQYEFIISSPCQCFSLTVNNTVAKRQLLPFTRAQYK